MLENFANFGKPVIAEVQLRLRKEGKSGAEQKFLTLIIAG